MTTATADGQEALIQFLYMAPIGLLQAGIDGTIEMLNPMSAQLLMPLVGGRGLDNLYTAFEGLVPELRSMVAAHGADSGVVCEGLRLPGSGMPGAPQTLSLGVLKLDPARLMATLVDATHDVRREQQGLDRRLRDAARTDFLTQLPNRAVLTERIARALAEPERRFALLFINCDRFKLVNDRLGHAAGNQLLTLLADRLRGALRGGHRAGPGASDTLVARTGGDEFAVLLDALAHPEHANAVGRRLLDVLAQPCTLGGERVHGAASLGIVLGSQATGDADALLHDATLAMRDSKRRGGNCATVFEPALRERAARRSGIEAELRLALTDGQLFVVYQPVVGLDAAGAVDRGAGVEALVRWRHPQRGIVPPLDFISVAEECGLIGAVGDFVLRTVCRDFVGWQRELGAAAPRLVAVNLSRAQLAQPGYTESVRALLQHSGMPAAALQLEVTESLAAQDDAVQQQLHALKALGVMLALDDFGTGYSSLSSLHLLPVDTVKIDRSFVSQADTSQHHRVLIEATVRVAASLAMRTVAEGVETAAQNDVVRTLGCDKGQGWLYSRPMLADDLLRWLGADAAGAAVEARTTSDGRSTMVASPAPPPALPARSDSSSSLAARSPIS